MEFPIKKLVMLAMVIFSISPMLSFADDSSRNQEIAERFAAADKNHDGKLTLAEAQAGMPRVAAHFSIIDADGNGYVTLVEIEAMANR